MKFPRTAAALVSAATLSLTGVAMAAPAQAAPVVTGGLVNVVVTDVIDDVTVEVSDVNVSIAAAAAIVANVCPAVNAQVGVISQQIARTGEFTCDAVADDQTVTVSQA